MVDPAKETAAWHASPAWTTVTIVRDRAVMPYTTFAALHNYSSSLPSGTYVGKRWCRLNGAAWWMGEYIDDPNPERIGIIWRPIDIVLNHGTPDEYTIVATVHGLDAAKMAGPWQVRSA